MITFKNLPDTTTPINAENLNANFTEANDNKISIANLTLTTLEVRTTTDLVSVGSYTIPNDGIYLITGYIQPNYYGQSGRELTFYIKKNGVNTLHMPVVINSYAYTVTANICNCFQASAGDTISFQIQSTSAVNWAFNGGKLVIVKLK